MAKLVRCELPDGVKRFEPFTVGDYRDFLLIRNDLDNHDIDTRIKIVDEILEEYFPNVPVAWRPYVFVKVFVSSIGKTIIPLTYECSECKKPINLILNLEQKPLINPVIETNGIKIYFKLMEYTANSPEELIFNSIDSVEQSGNHYNWSDLSQLEKNYVLSTIEYDLFEEIIEKLNPIFFRLNVKCTCNNSEKPPREIIYQSILPLFETLIHPDEIYTFYQIIHQMNKSNYSISEVMDMMPIERSIILSLIEKDKKK